MAGLRLSQKLFNQYQDALTVSHRRYEAEAQPIIETMQQYFRGQQWATPAGAPAAGSTAAMPQITANLVFADVKVMIPVLALRNPKVFVKPIGATAEAPMPTRGFGGQMGQEMQPVQIIDGKPIAVLDVARAKEALINYRWRELRLVKQVRRVLTDALLSPFGLMKIGYEMASEKVAITESGEAGEEIEPNELITAESPFAVRWSPTEFRVDPEARYPTLEDAEWVAFGSTHRLEDVKRNRRFKNTRDLQATVEVKQDWPTGVSKRPRLSDPQRPDDEDQRRVRLWEIWNKRTKMRMVVAEDHEKALEYVDWPQAYTGFPVETLCFTEHPDLLYGPPDLKQILGQQDAYNKLNSVIYNHVLRFCMRKLVTTRGAFDEKELEKLTQPWEGYIETDGEPDKAIAAVPDAPIPVDVWQSRANFREDHDRVSGVADFVRGVAEKVDTATEAAALQANLNVRTNDTRATVEDFAERISRKLLDIDAQTLNLPKSIPVIGPDGAYALREYVHVTSRETLLAHTDVEIEIGSMQPINESVRKRDAMELMGQFKGDPLTNQFKLRQLMVPAYREHIPEVSGLFYSRDEFEQMQQHQMQQMQAMSAGGMGPKPGTPPGRPASGPSRPPMGGARPPARPPAMAMAGSGAAGPRPVPGPVDQEV